MKVVSFFGTRPQFVKEAVLHQLFKIHGINEIIVNSGQHYDVNMSDVFFSVLKIREPDYNLNVGSGTHAEMTGKIMIGFEKILLDVNPDMVVVYGDTNTTLAGAITASKLDIRVAHVEAGIRMLPKNMPEEINRVLVDRISDQLFCPSHLAVKNLEKEGIIKNVHFTGDVMYDLFLKMENSFSYEMINELKLEEGKYIMVTLHRDYNVDKEEYLHKLLIALDKINTKIRVVFPIHPRTAKNVKNFKLEKYLKNITVIEPLDYLSLIGLVKKSWLVITDSGGLQKEAYFAGKKAVVVMPDTGWQELIDSKFNVLADAGNLFDKVFESTEIQLIPGIYGDGNAGEKIVELLIKELKST